MDDREELETTLTLESEVLGSISGSNTTTFDRLLNFSKPWFPYLWKQDKNMHAEDCKAAVWSNRTVWHDENVLSTLSRGIVPGHRWPVSTQNVASVTEEPKW
jgi:hypothetical protein